MFFLKLRSQFREDKIFSWLFLLCILIPLAFNIYSFEAYETLKLGLLAILLGALCFSLYAIYKRTNCLESRLPKKYLILLGLFVFWSLVISITAIDKNYSFFGFIPRHSNSFIFFSLFSFLIFAFSLISTEKLRFLVKVLFFCSGLIAIWGILQSMGFGYYSGPSVELFSRAAPSFLGNPNFSSMFVTTLIPLGLWMFLNEVKFKQKIYLGVSLFFQIWSLVIFSSRGALLALFFSLFTMLVLIFFTKSKNKIRDVFMVGGAICLLIFFTLLFLNFLRPGNISKTLSLKETNITQRFSVWKMGLTSASQSLIYGYGYGNFEIIFEQNRESTGLRTGFFDDPHNIFIYILVAGGVPLILLFLFLIIYPLIYSIKNSLVDFSDGYLIGVIGALVAWSVAAFFTPVVIPCYLLLAVIINLFFIKQQKYEPKLIGLFKFSVIFTGVFFIIFGFGFLIADSLNYQSAKKYNKSDFLAAYKLSKAASVINPFNSSYFQYVAASNVRSNANPESFESDLNKFAAFHNDRAHSYLQIANLNYIYFYATKNPKYVDGVFKNLDLAIQKDPYSVNNYFALAQYYLVFGKIKEAENAAKKGLELSPSYSGWMFLAKVYQIDNNKEGVLNSIYEALKISSDSDSLQSLLHLASQTEDITKLPFNIQLNIGQLD
jgi:O-antigen ligase